MVKKVKKEIKKPSAAKSETREPSTAKPTAKGGAAYVSDGAGGFKPALTNVQTDGKEVW